MLSTPTFDEGEIAFRQIPPGGSPVFYCDGRVPPVHRSLFLPSARDHDGLSMCRNRFRAITWCAFRVEKSETRFQLARVTIGQLNRACHEVGIADARLQATPDELDRQHGEPWAHFVVGAINRLEYETSEIAKKAIKEWALQMAEWIGESEILGPFRIPNEDDSYRPERTTGSATSR